MLSVVRDLSILGSAGECTLGKLYIDGAYECETLEDLIREVVGQPVESWKVPGKTAIPAGTYPLVIDFSNRFQHLMPHVLNVPGFTGIRIHAGNTAANTEGCILVGRARADNAILESRVAFEALFEKLKALVPTEIEIKSSTQNEEGQT